MSFLEINAASAINYQTSKEERFNVVNARGVLLKDRSLIGYEQIFNSGSQALLVATRTQLVIDGLGSGGFSTATLWNPINNHINLQDAKVGDYIDCSLLLPFTMGGFVTTITVQLDFSPALDGSQVITPPIGNSILGSPGNFEYNVKFNVTQEMKDNGIGIMVVANPANTIRGAELVLEVFPSVTDA